MNALYAEMLATAKELIDEFGRTIYVGKLSSASSDPAMPWKSAGPGAQPLVEVHEQRAVYCPNIGREWGSYQISEEQLSLCNNLMMFAADGNDYTDHTTILDGGDRWSVAWVNKLQPGDTVLLWYMGVEK